MAYISTGSGQLHYIKWGSGKRLLVAFHGYGNDADLFGLFTDHLKDEFTMLSFDLPHHGKSKWADDALLTRKDLVSLINKLKEEFNVDKVSLLGYSMGGRVSLSIVQDMPASIDKVVLLATDGLEVNYYYYFFTRTWTGRKIFRYMLHRPEGFLKMIGWLKKKNWIDASRHKFVTGYLAPEESRRLLKQVWQGMSDIIPSQKKLKDAIRNHHIPVSIFMGQYDKIMPPALAHKFKEDLDSVQVFVLEKGHRVFDNDNANQIAAQLL